MTDYMSLSAGTAAGARASPLATAGGTPALRITRYSETVVGVLEFWGDAGAGAAAGYFDVVAPGASAGGFAWRLHRALFGAARITFRRDGVVVGIVPVAAPFVDVVANVVETEGVGGVTCYRLGTGLPAGGVVGKDCGRASPQGKFFCSRPPRAACSHSASVGRR